MNARFGEMLYERHVVLQSSCYTIRAMCFTEQILQVIGGSLRC